VVLEGHTEIFDIIGKSNEFDAVNGNPTRAPQRLRKIDEHPRLHWVMEHISRQNHQIPAAEVEALLDFEQ